MYIDIPDFHELKQIPHPVKVPRPMEPSSQLLSTVTELAHFFHDTCLLKSQDVLYLFGCTI